MNDLLDIDKPVPITVRDAAILVGRSKIAVQKWIERGLLKPLAKDSRGFIVDKADVFRISDSIRQRKPCSK